MANNNIIYNAVLAGATGAQVTARWIVDTGASDYLSQRNAAAALANTIDALIPTDANLTEANGRLMTNIVSAVMSARAANSTAISRL